MRDLICTNMVEILSNSLLSEEARYCILMYLTELFVLKYYLIGNLCKKKESLMYEAIFKYCDISGIFQDFGQMFLDFIRNFWTLLYPLIQIIFCFLFLFIFLRNFVLILEHKFKVFVGDDFVWLIALIVYLNIFSPICWLLSQHFLITAPIIFIWTIWLNKKVFNK